MKATIRYTVHCSHEAFKCAMSQHMKDAKFHEIGWRDTDRLDEDSDTYSSFEWPNKRHPELTKDLFFLMATAAMRHDGKQAEFYVKAEILTDEGKYAATISDAWLPAWGRNGDETLAMYYRPELFNQDMAERMKKIAALAANRGDL